MEELFTTQGFISLLTLSALEIVLGIDNIIFISIVAAQLPPRFQGRARSIGLTLALAARVILLFSIVWIIGLKDDLFKLGDMGVSGRDLILFGGGTFLIYKTLIEIIHKIQHPLPDPVTGKAPRRKRSSFNNIIWQIVIVDIVFSFDSILTAVGLIDNVFIMICAVVIAMVVMLIFSSPIATFVNDNPPIKMLALVFLVAIGALLILEALEIHFGKEYLYVAMAFSLVVELLNMASRRPRRLKDGTLYHPTYGVMAEAPKKNPVPEAETNLSEED